MTLGPPEIIQALHEQTCDVLPFIVRGDSAGLKAARDLAKSDIELGPIRDLGLIDGIGLALSAKDAQALSQREDIIQVWYLHRWLYAEYVNIILSMQYVIKTAPAPVVMNISLGPPAALMPMPAHWEEPMNLATRIAAERGYIPIFAIGNYSHRNHRIPGLSARGVSPNGLSAWVRPVRTEPLYLPNRPAGWRVNRTPGRT